MRSNAHAIFMPIGKQNVEDNRSIMVGLGI